jgi:hypothetical protein
MSTAINVASSLHNFAPLVRLHLRVQLLTTRGLLWRSSKGDG